MSFADEEIAYLGSHPLARFASLCAGGQPDVVPVALEFDGTRFWVGGSRPERSAPASSAMSSAAGTRWPSS
ncbi:hypothetical protein [Streptomyces curacoi]|uniref:hypothetical protein n=1 Tax=Streptomyces curacoi TaxID=146536 RepID=UPI000AD06D98|nr:hypothetical protein [Streptomyces curacoi]